MSPGNRRVEVVARLVEHHRIDVERHVSRYGLDAVNDLLVNALSFVVDLVHEGLAVEADRARGASDGLEIWRGDEGVDIGGLGADPYHASVELAERVTRLDEGVGARLQLLLEGVGAVRAVVRGGVRRCDDNRLRVVAEAGGATLVRRTGRGRLDVLSQPLAGRDLIQRLHQRLGLVAS